MLLSQQFNEGIPVGIQAKARGLKVAHKTGSIGQISHDAAIIEDAKHRRSILVILTQGIKDGKAGEQLVAELASIVTEGVWSDSAEIALPATARGATAGSSR